MGVREATGGPNEMNVALKQHDDDWNLHSIPEATSLEEAAYHAVRAEHDFLTDTNHTWDAGWRHTTWGGKDVSWQSIRIYRAGDAPAYFGPPELATDYWFAVEYK